MSIDPVDSRAGAPADVGFADAAPVTDDEGLYCPVCEYNLTGLTSSRCPECGATFDRDSLAAAQKLGFHSLMPWDDPEPMPLVRRLRETLRICLFQPRRFAHAFSVQPRVTYVNSLFFVASFVISAIPAASFVFVASFLDLRYVGFSTRITSPIHMVPVGIALTVSLFATIWTWSLLTACVLWVGSPHADGARRFRAWYVITKYAAVHHMFIVPCAIAMLIIAWKAELALILGTIIGILASTMLASFTLWSVVCHRTPKQRQYDTVFFLLFVNCGFSVVAFFFFLEQCREIWRAIYLYL